MWHIVSSALALALSAPLATAQPAPAPIYAPALLAEWQPEFERQLTANANDLLLSRLTPAEVDRVRGVHFAFPLGGGLWPFHFLVYPDRRIELSVASLLFAKDMALAEAWLHVNGWSPSTLFDYMGALRFGRLDGLPPARRAPLAALGIPADAASDRRVLDRRNDTLGKLLLFVVAHELGHLLQAPPPAACAGADVAGCASLRRRQSEQAADDIAVELMRRAGLVPNAAALLFALNARYIGSPADITDAPARERFLAGMTHPLDAERVRALTASIERRRLSFAGAMADRQAGSVAVAGLLGQLRVLADGLADPTLAQHQTAIAKTLEPQDLLPRETPVPTLRPGPTALRATAPSSGYHQGEMRVGAAGAPRAVELLWNASATVGGAQVMVQGLRGRLTRRATVDGRAAYVMDLGGDLYDISLAAEPGEPVVEGVWRSRADPSVAGSITLRRPPAGVRLKV